MRNIKAAGHSVVPDAQLDTQFITQMISRMVQCHLLVSRGYKLISYYDLEKSDSMCAVVGSLESVLLRMDTMFQEPKQYMPYSECLWKWKDLKFYLDLLVSVAIKFREDLTKPQKPKKETQRKLISCPR